jgi:polar amino acid transport system substrate-binding protein
MPGDFIDLAEETGLIIPLGEYVLRTACRQSMEWERAGLTGIMMSVNISVKQINSLNIVQDILDIIDETHMIPEHLILEITESVAMENISKTIDIMNQLREKGVTFSLDDFGTGYSSLNYLKNIPINHLKIDKQFVQNLQRQTFEEVVVRSIIEIAHRMELTVVAEGIETLEQKEALASYNCDIAQGYYYSKPIPHQEVEELLKGI